MKVKLKSSKGRSASSNRWLMRQLSDPFVIKAKKEGLRSRAGFKIREIDAKFGLLGRGLKVVDIGAAPGGWSEYAVQKVGKGNVVAIDLLDMKPIEGVAFLRTDFTSEPAKDFIKEKLGDKADVVLSDIAPNTTGNASLDHLQIMALVEEAYDFALEVLAPGGAFVAKVRQGGTEAALLARMKRDFAKVAHFKPESSRKESSETYVVAIGGKP